MVNTDFLALLEQDIKKYTQEKQTAIRKAIDKRTGEMLTVIRRGSPVRQGTNYKRQQRYAPGAFRKGWKTVVLTDTSTKYLKAVAQNDNQKGLVHLLDGGHKIVTRNAARTVKGYVQGNNNVKNAQIRYTQRIKDDIQNILNN